MDFAFVLVDFAFALVDFAFALVDFAFALVDCVGYKGKRRIKRFRENFSYLVSSSIGG